MLAEMQKAERKEARVARNSGREKNKWQLSARKLEAKDRGKEPSGLL
jgi:hypothetical protein